MDGFVKSQHVTTLKIVSEFSSLQERHRDLFAIVRRAEELALLLAGKQNKILCSLGKNMLRLQSLNASKRNGRESEWEDQLAVIARLVE